MLCPSCKTELRIQRSRTEVEGDNSESTATKVYTVQDLVCVNQECPQYSPDGSNIIQEVRHLIYTK